MNMVKLWQPGESAVNDHLRFEDEPVGQYYNSHSNMFRSYGSHYKE